MVDAVPVAVVRVAHLAIPTALNLAIQENSPDGKKVIQPY